MEAKLTHIADAVEHCEVVESPNEIAFTTQKIYHMFLKQPELDAAVKRLAGRPVRITIKVGEPAAPASSPSSAPAVRSASAAAIPSTPAAAIPDDEATSRALENPEVQRFREMFPDSQVRTVRNLKDRS